MIQRVFQFIIACCAAIALLGAPASARGAKILVPDDAALAMMIKTTLIAFNQANLTGNYTVLRDLASPNFQQANTPARLGEIFQQERGKKVDISPVVVLRPEMLHKPSIDKRGILRLEGFFPSKPDLVYFMLAFENVGQTWKLVALGVKTSPPAPKVTSRPIGQVVADRNAGHRALTPNEFVQRSWPYWTGNWPYWTASLR
jgi:hypothetical protein